MSTQTFFGEELAPTREDDVSSAKGAVGLFFLVCKNNWKCQFWGLNIRGQKEDCNIAKLENVFAYVIFIYIYTYIILYYVIYIYIYVIPIRSMGVVYLPRCMVDFLW